MKMQRRGFQSASSKFEMLLAGGAVAMLHLSLVIPVHVWKPLLCSGQVQMGSMSTLHGGRASMQNFASSKSFIKQIEQQGVHDAL